MADEMDENAGTRASLAMVVLLKEQKEYAKEQFELEFKAVRYLLAAHGAGLAASLSLLKDYTTTPQLKGIGFFITCFAIGFLFAIISFIAAQIHQAEVMRVFFDGAPKDANVMQMVLRAQLPQWLSGAALFIAIFGIIYRFMWL